MQWLYVNQRPVEHRGLGFQLSQAFGSLVPHGRHPVAALFVTVDPGAVDVNVHPAKREVRFRQESAVMDALRHGVAAALRKADLFKGMDLQKISDSSEPSRAALQDGGHLGLNSLGDVWDQEGLPWAQGGAINIPVLWRGARQLAGLAR